MRKADRLFQLTNLIRVRQPITAEQIAEELEVSIRTVYRYIDDLSATGIPIFGTTGIGYQLHGNFELPPLNLSEKELDALMLGINMVRSWTGDDLASSAKSLVHKIESVLPQQLREEYSSVAFAPNLSDRKKDRHKWEILHKAIKNLNTIAINYKALNDDITSRVVYPLGLFYWGGKWTLGSWCTLRQDFRDFRVDRMIELESKNEPFSTSKTINIGKYLASVKKNRV